MLRLGDKAINEKSADIFFVFAYTFDAEKFMKIRSKRSDIKVFVVTVSEQNKIWYRYSVGPVKSITLIRQSAIWYTLQLSFHLPRATVEP